MLISYSSALAGIFARVRVTIVLEQGRTWEKITQVQFLVLSGFTKITVSVPVTLSIAVPQKSQKNPCIYHLCRRYALTMKHSITLD